MPKYINDENNEVPENKILFLKTNQYLREQYDVSEIIESLKGNTKRDWFSFASYMCLPLTIANQYGFIVKSAYDFSIFWDGNDDSELQVESEDPRFQNVFSPQSPGIQKFATNFKSGILSIVNYCVLRTPPGINLMTIQPPNMINNPDLFCISGVVESDNLRPIFTFNLKVLTPNKKIHIKKGDPLCGFIPIKRYFVENFSLENAEDYFDQETLESEYNDLDLHMWERQVVDPLTRKNGSGRRYFHGIHGDDTKFKDHQKNFKNKKDIED